VTRKQSIAEVIWPISFEHWLILNVAHAVLHFRYVCDFGHMQICFKTEDIIVTYII